MAGVFTNDEYTDMVLLYGEALENASKARRLYKERFPHRRLPSAVVFKRSVIRLRLVGAFDIQRSIRQRTVCDSEDAIQKVNVYLQENSTDSQRKVASELGVSRNSVRTILREQSWQPHQAQLIKQQPGEDLENLIEYCRRRNAEREKENPQPVKAGPLE